MPQKSWLEKMELELIEHINQRCPAREVARIIYRYIGKRPERFVEDRALSSVLEGTFYETIGEGLTIARVWRQNDLKGRDSAYRQLGGG